MTVINVWAMDKDQSIKYLLLSLQRAFGGKGYIIDESFQLNRRSVYICHPVSAELRAYIYTVGHDEGRFGIHLEYPPTIAGDDLMDIYENQTLESLIHILAVHLDIAEVSALSL